jgi:hypothetical protein
MLKKILFLLLLPLVHYGQKNTKTMRFEEVWVWEYENLEGEKGEVAIYRNDKTGYWLFTPEAYGTSGEMIEWIIGKPNGEYLMCYQDAELNSSLKYANFKVSFNPVTTLSYKPLGKSKTFGTTDLGYSLISGNSFEKTYNKTVDKSLYYIGTYPKINMYPIYYFNTIGGDTVLPIYFPQDLPSSQIVLEEVSKVGNKQMTIRFKFISSTEYYVEVPK